VLACDEVEVQVEGACWGGVGVCFAVHAGLRFLVE